MSKYRSVPLSYSHEAAEHFALLLGKRRLFPYALQVAFGQLDFVVGLSLHCLMKASLFPLTDAETDRALYYALAVAHRDGRIHVFHIDVRDLAEEEAWQPMPLALTYVQQLGQVWRDETERETASLTAYALTLYQQKEETADAL